MSAKKGELAVTNTEKGLLLNKQLKSTLKKNDYVEAFKINKIQES